MIKHRVCLNCGKKMNLFKGILFNNCCSYDCDMEYEKYKIREDREQWEKNRIEKSIKIMNENSRYSYRPSTVSEDKSEEENYDNAYPIISDFSDGGATSLNNVNEFYDYTITDDNDSEDYTY